MKLKPWHPRLRDLITSPGWAAHAGPDTIPIQPAPLRCLVGRHATAEGVEVKVVERFWRDGDTRRCQLCDECRAVHDLNFCGIITSREIGRTPAEVARFGLRAPAAAE
jgi:hypothetical protein